MSSQPLSDRLQWAAVRMFLKGEGWRSDAGARSRRDVPIAAPTIEHLTSGR